MLLSSVTSNCRTSTAASLRRAEREETPDRWQVAAPEERVNAALEPTTKGSDNMNSDQTGLLLLLQEIRKQAERNKLKHLCHWDE